MLRPLVMAALVDEKVIEREFRNALAKAITQDRFGSPQTGVVRISDFKLSNASRFAPPGMLTPLSLLNCPLWDHVEGRIPQQLKREIDEAVELAVEKLVHDGLGRRGGTVGNSRYPEDDWVTLTISGVRTLGGLARAPATNAALAVSAAPAESRMSSPQIFISYTHEDSVHKAWVLKLATDLRDNGIDVVLDQWDLKKGDDMTLFMERGVRNACRVLLVFTPGYCTKANERVGGVGYESLVITGELAGMLDTNKFVGVLRRGDWSISVPTYAKTRCHVDMREDADYSSRLEDLLREFHNAPANPKPALGKNPFTP